MMKREEYIRIQVESSAWTRRNPGNMALVRDAIREFGKYTPETYRVLEAGCGDGYSIDVLQAEGYQHVVGCDINLTKLKVAASVGHAVAAQDVHSLGFRDQVFDAVYCTHTLEHTYDGYLALREICRVLRPGGFVFIIVPDHFRLYGDTFVEPNEVVPLEQRSVGFFEDILFERKGRRCSTPRNQFPFTMKLLLAALIETGFDLQWAARIARNGPELWAIATKPELGGDRVKPLIERAWLDQSPVRKLWNRAKGMKSLIGRFRSTPGISTSSEAERKVEGQRLVYYLYTADADFWDNHWRIHLSPEIYKRAEQGNLGRLEDPFTRYLPRQGRILEAGCGLGQYVLALRARGYEAEGVEWGTETVRTVRELWPDLPIRVGDVTNLDVPDGYYAAYISLGVVEHRQEGPEPFLHEAWRVLAPGGVVLISVPYLHPLRRLKARLGLYRGRTDGLEFYQYAFTREEFSDIVREAGFEILETRSHGGFKGVKDEIPLIRRMLGWWGVGWLLIRLLYRWRYAEQHLGNMLMIIGRKPEGD